ncbi:Pol polyprotein, partial [Mucuna pruriens]
MESDYCQHVKRCIKCQMYVDNIYTAPSALHNLTSLWPFSMWGLDMIGPIEPKASNGHRFILVATDYFTKWVEAASYANVTKSVVIKFIKRGIICRYDLPTHIITDNGTNLNNKMMTELCKQFRIKHHNSTPYRPKMNVAIEAANKNIKKIVQKMVVTYRDWHDMLPYALHGYRTSVRTRFGVGPKSAGSIEFNRRKTSNRNMPSPAIPKQNKKHFQQKNQAIRDLVLKKRLPHDKDPRGKWAPNYGGHMWSNVHSQGALVLADSEGQELKHSVNADTVKWSLESLIEENPKNQPPNLQNGGVSIIRH